MVTQICDRLAKRDQNALPIEIELLVPLECTIYGKLNGAIDATICCSVAKLWSAKRGLLVKHCFELDAFLLRNDCLPLISVYYT